MNRDRPSVRRLAATVLCAASILGACRRAEPPSRSPDFVGVVVGRTPRLDAPPRPSRLTILEAARPGAPGTAAAEPARIQVDAGEGVQVLRAVPGGGYRATQTSEAWMGRTVRVWFAEGEARGTALRQAETIVVAPPAADPATSPLPPR
jgi:hypothetical protein